MEDSRYFLPTKDNMEVIISYLGELFKKLEIHYVADATDCDDFARLKSELAQLILGQAYGIEASPTIFTIFVQQKTTWASVPAGGGHAVCAFACFNEETGKAEAYVWEPQNDELIAANDYPNKNWVFYVGAKAVREISKKRQEKMEDEK